MRRAEKEKRGKYYKSEIEKERKRAKGKVGAKERKQIVKDTPIAEREMQTETDRR